MAQPALSIYNAASGQPISGGRWPGGLLRGDAALGAVVGGGAMVSSPSAMEGDVALGDIAAAGSLAIQPMPPAALVADGVWTWFSDPRAVEHDVSGERVTDIGYITSAGSPSVTRVPHSDVAGRSNFTLRAAMEVDDHDNPALLVRPDSKLIAAYCRHPDTAADVHRVRINSAAGSIAAWGAESNPSATDPSYAGLTYLSTPGRTYLNYRSGSSGTYPQNAIVSSDDGATWGGEETWFSHSGQRPYPKWASNGINRIDVFTTDGHPAGLSTSVYHFYIIFAGDGGKTFYKSDGTLLGAGPIDPTNGTLVYNGSSQRAWTWDITYDADGHPCVLFAKFVSTTDHRLMFARWTGSAWTTPAQVVAMGSRLYTAETYYSAGACFDGNTPDRVFACVESSGASDLAEYRTADSGATWAKHRDITIGGGTKNIRPWSPRGHNGLIAVLWCRGTYTTYTSYSMEIWGAG